MGKRKKHKKKRKRSTPGCLGRLTRLGLKLTAILLLGAAGLAGWWWLTWPDVGSLSHRDPETTAFIEQSRQAGHQIRWTPIPGKTISDQLRIAVLVAEDISFFQHNGFATDEIEAALRTAFEKRDLPRGASTISQQLAKNLWLSPSKNPLRKLHEALLTRELERQLTKERILDLYLNVAEFGPAIFGAEAASRHFFGKPATALDAHQAAALAAGLSRPSRWHPGCGSSAYQRHVRTIRHRMEKARGLPI